MRMIVVPSMNRAFIKFLFFKKVSCNMVVIDFSICFSVEYCVSYVYHALYAYFDRDNVALKGLAK